MVRSKDKQGKDGKGHKEGKGKHKDGKRDKGKRKGPWTK